MATKDEIVKDPAICNAEEAICDAPDREAMIAECAFYKAEQRGFEPGHELEDWLEAEQECILYEAGKPVVKEAAQDIQVAA
jgi:hypothetical protein